jgi:hypothetical protein
MTWFFGRGAVALTHYSFRLHPAHKNKYTSRTDTPPAEIRYFYKFIYNPDTLKSSYTKEFLNPSGPTVSRCGDAQNIQHENIASISIENSMKYDGSTMVRIK